MYKVKLGDICTVVSGSTPKSNVEEYWNGSIKWITPAEITSDSYIITDTERHITDKAVEKTNLTLLPVGTVLLSSRAPIGKTAITGAEMYCNQGFKNLICSERIYNKYLYFFLNSKVDYLNELGRGATFKEISKGIVEEVEIPLPSLDEQKNIVRHLEVIQQLINNRKQALSTLDELVKSRFIEMFGDPVTNPYGLPVVKLKKLAVLITKGASPKWQGFAYSDDESQTLFVTSENVREGFLDLTAPKYIEDGFNDKQKRSMLQRDDILINIVGASIGRAAKFDIEQKANINQAVALVRIEDKQINLNYLLQYLNSEKALQMYDAMKSDVARANLSLQDIGNLDILVPHRREQDAYADFVAQVDKSKFAVQQSIDTLQILKAKLMQDYFG